MHCVVGVGGVSLRWRRPPLTKRPPEVPRQRPSHGLRRTFDLFSRSLQPHTPRPRQRQNTAASPRAATRPPRPVDGRGRGACLVRAAREPHRSAASTSASPRYPASRCGSDSTRTRVARSPGPPAARREVPVTPSSRERAPPPAVPWRLCQSILRATDSGSGRLGSAHDQAAVHGIPPPESRQFFPTVAWHARLRYIAHLLGCWAEALGLASVERGRFSSDGGSGVFSRAPLSPGQGIGG